MQPRSFSACFEIRIDGADPLTSPHPNVAAYDDGRYMYRCLNTTGTLEETFDAASNVDVRMAWGAERDERFDWTRFYVMNVSSKEQCQDGGWQAFGFANQGQCIRYVMTGKK